MSDGDARARQFLSEAKDALGKGDLKTAAVKVRVLENVQRVTPRYQQSLGEVFTQVVGLPVERFSLKVEEGLRASARVVHSGELSGARRVRGERRRDCSERWISGTRARPRSIRFRRRFASAVFFDYDLDGDLDVYLLGGNRPDQLLRNNLDGTYTDVTAKTGDAAFQSKKAVASDVDRDGDLDLVAIDAKGDLVLRLNLRQGVFRTVPLARLRRDGPCCRRRERGRDSGHSGRYGQGASPSHRQGRWEFLGRRGERARRGAAPGRGESGRAGGLRQRRLSGRDRGLFGRLARVSQPRAAASLRTGPSSLHLQRNLLFHLFHLRTSDALLAFDVDRDGDLDLLVSAGGKTSVLVNDGGNANGWLTVALEGLATGSGKVNRGGVGSLVEVKAGKPRRDAHGGPVAVHVGLGARTKADVVRATWTNGVPQNLFDQKAKTVVKEVQQLKGSCPFVYAHNGETGVWSFVSDALGRAPIGLLYDGVHLAGADTREWLLVPEGMLAPTPDGRLLLDYTEELWEAAYLDEVSLMVVDHPIGTSVVPNERMIPGATEKKLFTVATPAPGARRVVGRVGPHGGRDGAARARGQGLRRPGRRDGLPGRAPGARARPRPRAGCEGQPSRPLPERLDLLHGHVDQRLPLAAEGPRRISRPSSRCRTAGAAGRSRWSRSDSRPGRRRRCRST